MLRHWPLSQLSDDGTVLELEHHSLDSAPRYIALSYTWGQAFYRGDRSPSATYSVTLSGSAFPVQENLHDALTYLAWRVRKKGCLFWVDAICINQTDPEERSSQVAQMRHIYDHAFSVYVWLELPCDEEETRLAVEMMEKCSQRMDDDFKANNNQLLYATSLKLAERDSETAPEPGTERYRAWLGITNMFNDRPYWRRSWIYQEATGPAHTCYFCGGHSFGAHMISSALAMSIYFMNHPNLDSELCFGIFISGARDVDGFRRNGNFYNGAALLTLLNAIRPTSCTDPRDKVYAVRGMAEDLGAGDVVPDYSRSVEAVYTDVARFSLSQPSDGLNIFGHVVFPPADSTLMGCMHDGPRIPTWTPDWRDILGVRPFSERLNGQSGYYTLDTDEKAYRAHGPNPTHNAHVEGASLKLDGYYVDRVSTVLPMWEQDWQDMRVVKSWAPSNGDKLYCPTGQTFGLAFRTTIVADIQLDGRSRGNAVRWDLLHKKTDRLGPDEVACRTNTLYPLLCTCSYRRLCWTAKGYMGIAPAATQADDIVCIFFGGQVPHILRDAGEGHYKLIGECYIHGIMDGEAFEGPDFDPVNLKTFILD